MTADVSRNNCSSGIRIENTLDILSSAEGRVMNSNKYHFVRSFEIQVAKTTNGQKKGSAEESTLDIF